MNIETYRPTPEDIIRLRPKDGFLKVSGDGIFATRQGEGVTAGKPAVFLRLHLCNLACGRDSGWQCDTWYTWDKRTPEFWQEPQDIRLNDVASQIAGAWDNVFSENEGRRTVITGGEPLLQQRKLVGLIALLPEWAVEIETNGTLAPLPELARCQFNCSPKLDNSGNTLSLRYRPEALRVINSMPNAWFKFVVTEPGDFAEIDHILSECNITAERVLIMPEGRTVAEVEAHRFIIEPGIKMRGWNLTLRNQLVWFGSKRST